MTHNYHRLTETETYNGKPETTTAYAAFCVYRDMETDKRSLEEVGKSTGKVRRLLERWSSQYQWVARAAAYDDERRERDRIAAEDERIKARDERKRLIRSAKSSLALALTTFNRKMQAGEELSANEVTQLMKMVLNEERAEYDDLPTQRNEHSGPDGGAVQTLIILPAKEAVADELG